MSRDTHILSFCRICILVFRFNQAGRAERFHPCILRSMTDLDPITQIQLMSGGYYLSRLTLLNRCGFHQVQEIPVGAGHSIVVEAVAR
jgi:hypothetical protein